MLKNDPPNATFINSTSEQNQLLQFQNKILQDIAEGHTGFQKTLDNLCLHAESLLPNSIASIMLFDAEQKVLNIQAAPSAPEAVIDALSQVKPGLKSGSCAKAVFSNEPTYVKDTFNDSIWTNIKTVAKKYNIQSCWSFPIRSSKLEPVGSFALSSFEHRLPNDFQKQLLQTASSLVAILLNKKQQQKQLWHLAHHDSLTNLPNRLLFQSQLERAIEHAKRNDKKLAVVYIDLDNFKQINDNFGHDVGDKVLLESMSIIEKSIRAEDILSRHGGDEFTLLLENLNDVIDAETITKKIISAFEHPLEIQDKKLRISYSIGISTFPDDGDSPEILLKHSDIAMYQAKSTGKNNIKFFKPELAERIHQKMKIETEMRQALENNEFEIYYQPQFSAYDGRIISLEALIRWNHPDRKFLTPDSFIPIAEQSNLINDITTWVLRSACEQGKLWIENGIDLPPIAVNISTSQLTDTCFNRIKDILQQTGLPPEKLELEITETLIMNRGQQGIDELNKIRDYGISLAMDDFGTGYSSLSQLKSLPINKLKIDQSFVQNIPQSESDMIITNTIIAMGLSLGIRTVAEGVETKTQQDYLQKYGCDILQGFLLSRPLPASDMNKMLEQGFKQQVH